MDLYKGDFALGNPILRRRTWLEYGVLGWPGINSALAFPAQGLGGARQTVRVAAASDLKFALAHLVSLFQKETGHRVEVSYGASGNFARQIQQGLPVDLFMSADESLVFGLADARLTWAAAATSGEPGDRGALYAVGRIALYVPKDSPIALDAELAGLKARWERVNKFAIANPEHAPYGRAAREALSKLGLWERIKPKLVLGENIAQATQFVATGAAQAGISALSLVLAPEVAQWGRHLVLPDTLHAPLRQRMVLLKAASPAAVKLYAYLQTGAAREVLRRHGFPG